MTYACDLNRLKTVSVFKHISQVVILVALTACVLLIPPLLGAHVAGAVPENLLSFPPPPRPTWTGHFSWVVFVALGGFIVCVLAPVARALWVTRGGRDAKPPARRRAFPRWGMFGVALLGASWMFAWTRFEWFAPLQAYTFTPLWLGYIVSINASCWRRTGQCPMLDKPIVFCSLFPLSALFWWFFEYLNRFVANWYYLGLAEATPFSYVFSASMAFSTVLPAFVSTLRWLQSFDRFSCAFIGWRAIRVGGLAGVAPAGLCVAVGLLFALGYAPRWFFPFAWIAPLLALLSLEVLVGRRSILAPVAVGDWRTVWQPALAALVCGFFWELWNTGSYSHWVYSVPLVDRFHVFAMPVLGYAGYLPFGVECAVVVGMVSRRIMWLAPRG